MATHIDWSTDYDNNDGGSAISQPFTTLDRDVQPDPAFYAEQRLPAGGFGYITIRDGTKLTRHGRYPAPRTGACNRP